MFYQMSRRRIKKRSSTRRAARFAALAVGAAATPAMGQLLGQHLYPTNYPWNQDISAAPVATNSGTIISNIGTTVRVHPDWGTDSSSNGASPLYGIPFNIVHGNSTTKINVVIDNYPGESDLVPAPIQANVVIEGDYQNGPNANGPGYGANQRGDSHLIVWDEDNNVGYEFYEATRPSDAQLFDGTPHTDGKWHAASETVWNFNTNQFRTLGHTSADAAGLSILAGLARPDEGLTVAQGGQGAINHALRLTLPSSIISDHYIYPASHIVTKPGIVPMGARFRLKNNTTVNNLIAMMGPQAQNVAHAMQTYGLIVADVGSAMFVTGASGSVNSANQLSLVWNMNDIQGSTGLQSLNAGDFDVVNLTPLVTNLSASNGPAGGTLTINGQNFSGAAGQLFVFFGTNAASNVTVLSDTQVSVTIPNGTGTVDVKVQSGLNEADTNDASGSNVNQPIFGYGTSAAVPADKFTFSLAMPTIQSAQVIAGNFFMRGNNNSGAGGTYSVLSASSLTTPRSNWTVMTSGSFDGGGNFSFSNAITPGAKVFYLLRVP